MSPTGKPPPPMVVPGQPRLEGAALAVPPTPPAASAATERWPAPWRTLYGLYAWTQFLLIGLSTLILLLLPTTLRRRRRLVRGATRLILRLVGIRVCVVSHTAPATRSAGRVTGLPAPCVIVANHCSYLDGVLLAGTLPPSFSFVIKREMAAVPLAGLLLRRIGVEFMERRDRGRVLRDTRRVLRHAAGGQALVFFPEGTFSHRIGLLRFHIGAFAAATRARLPLVPLVIHGTRHCLPPGSLWPRPGRVEVRILPAIAAASERPEATEGPASAAAADDPTAAHGPTAAAMLRERVRAAMLALLGEPDLANVAMTAADRAAAPPE